MLKKVGLFLQTARHLRLRQVTHQVKYRLVKPRPLATYGHSGVSKTVRLASSVPPVVNGWYGGERFVFLNLEVDFGKQIDWDYQDNGKLWNYNLQYANYLLQTDRTDTEKEQLITDLYRWLSDGRLSLEPYPVSLRTINMMRWLSQRRSESSQLQRWVYAELDFLSRRLEYHLLGNHLLENAFALIMGGAFFSNKSWVKTGKRILQEELKEQTLSDGAHFELSPMYHQIIFYRLLELIDWYSKWEGNEQCFENFLKIKASGMRSWLEQISFRNGDIPHFNDSADGIAYSTPWLLTYADRLGIPASDMPLAESGYRSVSLGNYECKIDLAQIGPSYQPGHAHADALGFILYYKGAPLFVEQGTSTYQISAARDRERSTAAHNTVVVNKQNQSNVWGGFRVADRARTKITMDIDGQIKGEHDGYRKFGINHIRTFRFDVGAIHMEDRLQGNDGCVKEFHLHVSPGLDVNIQGNSVKISNGVTVKFQPNVVIQMEAYTMANGFNRYQTGRKIIVPFKNILSSTILMEDEF